MLVMEMDELFPEATATDIKRAKADLTKYKKQKRIVELFERNPPQSDEKKKQQAEAIRFTNLIERAVNEIIDLDVKAVIEYRFIRGNSRAATILRFSGWDYCDKTIDRRIDEGAESVANTLLYLE